MIFVPHALSSSPGPPHPSSGSQTREASFYNLLTFLFQGASLMAQLVKNPPAVQETQFDSWVGKIRWGRDRLPTPVFLGFPHDSASKESACKIPWRRERLPTPVFWTGEFHRLYYRVAKSRTRLSNFHFSLSNFLFLIYIRTQLSYQPALTLCWWGSMLPLQGVLGPHRMALGSQVPLLWI